MSGATAPWRSNVCQQRLLWLELRRQRNSAGAASSAQQPLPSLCLAKDSVTEGSFPSHPEQLRIRPQVCTPSVHCESSHEVGTTCKNGGRGQTRISLTRKKRMSCTRTAETEKCWVNAWDRSRTDEETHITRWFDGQAAMVALLAAPPAALSILSKEEGGWGWGWGWVAGRKRIRNKAGRRIRKTCRARRLLAKHRWGKGGFRVARARQGEAWRRPQARTRVA